jgi:hypothetical protein
MDDYRYLIIYFNNATRMEVSFPTQIKNSPAASMPGAALPFGAIKGARILASDESAPK